MLFTSLTLALAAGQVTPQDETARIPVELPETGEHPAINEDYDSKPSEAKPDLFIALVEAPQFRQLRSDLDIPLPGGASNEHYNVLNHLYADVRGNVEIAPRIQTSLSLRLNSFLPISGEYLDNRTRLDVREAFVTWAPTDGLIVEAGRINARTGVAAAFNPTDFFRGRTVVDTVSVDPSVLRLNRLGVVMARITATAGPASTVVTLVPELSKRENVIQGDRSFADLRLGRVNSRKAAELRSSFDLKDGTSLQFSTLLKDGRSPAFGFNGVRGIGNRTTVFAEVAVQRTANVILEAVNEGILSGELPSAAANLIPLGSRRYRPSVAVGVTYTTPSRITLTAEYDYEGGGLSRRQWRNLVAKVKATPVMELGRGAFWYGRSLVQQEQQLASRGQVFLRAAFDDAFGKKGLDLSTLAIIPTSDRSILAQAAVDYEYSDAWSIGGLLQFSAGSRSSIFGGSPQSAGFQIYLKRYF